ncbi:MAG: T9SS type A sorting domain-containing protein [Bacteroidetes bacterium]|nr:MAG: T9SS type A sorting domain-containing protein [Bacteroidota bacterium]
MGELTTGFVIAGQYAPIFNGTILRTLNGGLTWDTTNFNYNNYAINFINDSLGFLAGQDMTIYRTTDLGFSWNFISGGGPGLNDISGLHFLNADSGFITSGFRLYKTDNGSQNIQMEYDSLGWIGYPESSKIFFTDSLIGYVINSSIAKTINRGLDWYNLSTPINFVPKSAYFFNSQEGIIVGDQGKVSKTFDGGLSWSVPDLIGLYPLHDIHFVSDSIGFIIGGKDSFNNQVSNGIIYTTFNRGLTWTTLNSSYHDALLKFSFPSDSVGYAIGFNGLIIKIRNANSMFTSITTLSTNPRKHEFFPNPCRTTLNIEGIESSPFRIFNVLGEIIMNGALDFGITSIDVSEFASGIYILVIGNRTEKFIKE